MKKLAVTVSFLLTVLTYSCNRNERKIDTYENLKKDLKGVEVEKVTPHAAPD